MLKPDRFSCSQKIWLKQDPPVLGKEIWGKTAFFEDNVGVHIHKTFVSKI